MSNTQPLADGLCLRFSGDIAPNPSLNVEMATNILLRGTQAASTVPFVWGYIDRPQDGSIYLLFLAPHMQFPIDGLRFQENEQRYTVPVGNGREMEVTEAKFGFAPGSQDRMAARIRRKFRLIKGGTPQLWLVHYSRGQEMAIIPSINHPVRSYPLPPATQPAVYVMGDKAGQKVLPAGGAQPPATLPAPSIGVNFGNAPQSMLVQQNRQMEALERRSAQEREQRARSGSTVNRATTLNYEEEENDDKEMISSRTLALTRFRRNHEFMDEVFIQAALGDRKQPKRQSPYSIFDQSELEQKVEKLASELQELENNMAARKAARANLMQTVSSPMLMS